MMYKSGIFHATVLLLASNTVFSSTPSQTAERTTPAALNGVYQEDDRERLDRMIDRAALASEREAVKKLKGMLQKKRGGPQESALLFRLAESLKISSELQFRIAHGSKKEGSTEFQRYKEGLAEEIVVLTELVSRHSDFEEMDRVLFMRGKAFEELKKKKESKQDFLLLTQKFPFSESLAASFMSLADFAIDDNEHKEAVAHLHQIEKIEGTPYLPYAYYKLAWSYYNLKEVSSALGYLDKHIAFYRAKSKGNSIATSDQAVIENSLMDLSLFYYEGLANRPEKFPLEDTLSYFKDRNPGTHLGRMNIRFASLLRANQKREELMAWKNLLMKKESDRPETLDVVVVVLDDFGNRNIHTELVQASQDLVKLVDGHPELRKVESFNKAQRSLAEAIERYRGLTLKNKEATEVKVLANTLADLTFAYEALVGANEPKALLARANLAEAQFAIKDYAHATLNYRNVVERKSQKEAADMALKAIASRYEEIREKGWLPKELKPVSLSSDKGEVREGLLADWIQWLDAFPLASQSESFENLWFEGTRVLYHLGYLQLAYARLVRFVETQSKSRYAVPAATLALDTLILSKNPKDIHELAVKFGSVKAWEKTDFGSRLRKVEADSDTQLIEIEFNSGAFESVIGRVSKVVKKPQYAERAPELLLLSARASLKLNKHESARESFSELLDKFPKSDVAAQALLGRMTLNQDALKFKEAAEDGIRYALQSKKFNSDLWQSTLLSAWLSGGLQKAWGQLKTVSPCSDALVCNRFFLLLELEEGKTSLAAAGIDDEDREEASTSASDRALEILALMQDRGSWGKLKFKRRVKLLTEFPKAWTGLDPLMKSVVLSRVLKTVPSAFESLEPDTLETKIIMADPFMVRKYVKSLKDAEEAGSAIVGMPFVAPKERVLRSLAKMYLNTAQSIRALRIPKSWEESDKQLFASSVDQIVAPVEGKSKELVANAEQVKTVGDTALASVPVATQFARNQIERSSHVWAERFLEALDKKDLRLASYYAEKAKADDQLTPGVRSSMTALLLADSGAGSEAVAILKETFGEVVTGSGAKSQMAMITP